ncbi:MAG: gluconate 2-dehydrogenase subunit 3 family protein [Myxococcales bacterium]
MAPPDHNPGLTRRLLLKRGVFGGALLLLGGTGLALRPGRPRAPNGPLRFFSAAEYATFAAIAERVIPAAEGWKSAAELRVAEKADALLAEVDPRVGAELKGLLGLFENALAGLLFDLSPAPFTARPEEAQDATLEAWQNSRLALRRSGFKALKNLAIACYYGSPEAWPQVGYRGPPELMLPEALMPPILEPGRRRE